MLWSCCWWSAACRCGIGSWWESLCFWPGGHGYRADPWAGGGSWCVPCRWRQCPLRWKTKNKTLSYVEYSLLQCSKRSQWFPSIGISSIKQNIRGREFRMGYCDEQEEKKTRKGTARHRTGLASLTGSMGKSHLQAIRTNPDTALWFASASHLPYSAVFPLPETSRLSCP